MGEPVPLLKMILVLAIILAFGAVAGLGIVAANDLFMLGTPSDFLGERG